MSILKHIRKADVKKVIDTIPPNTEIYTGGKYLSKWDGYLASVYTPFSDYDFDPETVTRMYSVFFVDDGKGKPLKVGEDWKRLVGCSYQTNKNKFVTSLPMGKGLQGTFLNSTNFYVKVAIKYLSKAESGKYATFLDRQGFKDIDDLVIFHGLKKPLSQKEIKLLLSGKIKDFDSLYEEFKKALGEDAGTTLANQIYNYLSRGTSTEEQENQKLKELISVKGFYLRDKQGKFKYIIKK